jgi:hypothetical protein
LKQPGATYLDGFKTVAWELGKYKLNLVSVQEIRWEKKAKEYMFFFMERGMKIIS